MKEKKNLLSQNTEIWDADDELIISKSARLVFSTPPRLEAHDRSKALSRRSIGIGRDKSNGVIIADPLVSKFHAIITVKKGAAYIRDTGSTNGTFVNDERVSDRIPRELRRGDQVLLGGTKLTIAY